MQNTNIGKIVGTDHCFLIFYYNVTTKPLYVIELQADVITYGTVLDLFVQTKKKLCWGNPSAMQYITFVKASKSVEEPTGGLVKLLCYFAD